MTESVEASKKSEELQKMPEEAPEKTQELSKKPEEPSEKAREEEITGVSVTSKAARGRPRGSRDSAPRVRRVPIMVPDQEPPPEVKRPPTRNVAKQVRILPEKEEEEEEEEEEVPEQEPEPPKSPRTLRKERVQAHAAERRSMQQAKQARFDHLLDTFMGY